MFCHCFEESQGTELVEVIYYIPEKIFFEMINLVLEIIAISAEKYIYIYILHSVIQRLQLNSSEMYVRSKIFIKLP